MGLSVPSDIASLIVAGESREHFLGRGGEIRLEPDRVAEARGYVRVFTITMTADSVGTATVLKAAELLFGVYVGAVYVADGESDTDSACVGVRAETNSPDGRGWLVTAQYEALEDPLSVRRTLQYDYQPYEKIFEKDVENKAVLNSAKDPFDPPPLIDDSRPVLVITRNEGTYDEAIVRAYKDRINVATFRGNPPRTVKCNAIKGREIWSPRVPYNDGIYYEVTYEFAIRPEGWDMRLLDCGYRAIDPATDKKTLISIDDGTTVTVPVPLDGMGQKALVKAGETFAGVYLTFKPFLTADFNDLGF